MVNPLAVDRRTVFIHICHQELPEMPHNGSTNAILNYPFDNGFRLDIAELFQRYFLHEFSLIQDADQVGSHHPHHRDHQHPYARRIVSSCAASFVKALAHHRPRCPYRYHFLEMRVHGFVVQRADPVFPVARYGLDAPSSLQQRDVPLLIYLRRRHRQSQPLNIDREPHFGRSRCTTSVSDPTVLDRRRIRTPQDPLQRDPRRPHRLLRSCQLQHLCRPGCHLCRRKEQAETMVEVMTVRRDASGCEWERKVGWGRNLSDA